MTGRAIVGYRGNPDGVNDNAGAVGPRLRPGCAAFDKPG